MNDLKPEAAEQLRLTVQNLPYQYALSNNHDTEFFTYWYFNLVGSTDANVHDQTMRLFEHPRGGNVSAICNFWQDLRKARYPKAKLLRAIAYVHTLESGIYPHISLGGKKGDRTIVVYLNKYWEPKWKGETVLTGDNLHVPTIYPMPCTYLDFPAHWGSYCQPSVGTVRPRVSLVLRITP